MLECLLAQVGRLAQRLAMQPPPVPPRFPLASALMARRGVRSGPYNGAAKVQGAPAAKNGSCAAMELVWVYHGLYMAILCRLYYVFSTICFPFFVAIFSISCGGEEGISATIQHIG